MSIIPGGPISGGRPAEDLPLVARVLVSTMPTKAGQVFTALIQNEGRPLTVEGAQVALGVQHHKTARKVLRDLKARGVVDFVEPGPGKTATAHLQPQWQWCASCEARALLSRERVTSPGV
jgi:hypothetical protein